MGLRKVSMIDPSLAASAMRSASDGDEMRGTKMVNSSPARRASNGRSAPFVDGIDGDPGNVIGLSLPLLRTLLAELDVVLTDLWAS